MADAAKEAAPAKDAAAAPAAPANGAAGAAASAAAAPAKAAADKAADPKQQLSSEEVKATAVARSFIADVQAAQVAEKKTLFNALKVDTTLGTREG